MITALYSKYMIVKTKGKGKKQDPNLFGPKESLGSEKQRQKLNKPAKTFLGDFLTTSPLSKTNIL